MRLRTDLILRQMGTEYVIVDPSQDVVDMSKVFTLNSTAAFLWKELESVDFSIESLTDLLIEQYDVGYEQALNDAIVLVEQFAREELLES